MQFDRRKFIQNCCLLTLAAATARQMRSFQSTNSAAVELNMPNPNFLHLRRFSEFKQIEAILSQYNAQLTFNQNQAESIEIENKIININNTYGRWSNFSFQKFSKRMTENIGYAEQLSIYTAGPAGLRLSRQTDLKIVAKISPELEKKMVIYDAYPHYFNLYMFRKNRFQNERNYFVDNTSRFPIQLGYKLAQNLNLNDRHQRQLDLLKNELQRKINFNESYCLDQISKQADCFSFSEVINLKKNISLV